jgi:hypothetical protein
MLVFDVFSSGGLPAVNKTFGLLTPGQLYSERHSSNLPGIFVITSFLLSQRFSPDGKPTKQRPRSGVLNEKYNGE